MRNWLNFFILARRYIFFRDSFSFSFKPDGQVFSTFKNFIKFRIDQLLLLDQLINFRILSEFNGFY